MALDCGVMREEGWLGAFRRTPPGTVLTRHPTPAGQSLYVRLRHAHAGPNAKRCPCTLGCPRRACSRGPGPPPPPAPAETWVLCHQPPQAAWVGSALGPQSTCPVRGAHRPRRGGSSVGSDGACPSTEAGPCPLPTVQPQLLGTMGIFATQPRLVG